MARSVNHSLAILCGAIGADRPALGYVIVEIIAAELLLR
jgi:uncharacterized protein YebE (UPF0316 family)